VARWEHECAGEQKKGMKSELKIALRDLFQNDNFEYFSHLSLLVSWSKSACYGAGAQAFYDSNVSFEIWRS